MKSKFLKAYSLFMESITENGKTIRTGISKIDAMTSVQFLEFLRDLMSNLNSDGTVNQNNVRITEKMDGNACRMESLNGKMKFGYAYNDLLDAEDVPFSVTAIKLRNIYENIFAEIAKEINSDFKLIGELIICDGLIDDGKVTPVAASYDAKYFGSIGAMIIFELNKISFIDGKISVSSFSKMDEDKLKSLIKEKLNTEFFKFYLTEEIDITRNVVFSFDKEILLKINELISNPLLFKGDFEKDSDNYKASDKLIRSLKNEIDEIKELIINRISKIIDASKGAFSNQGDLKEGIVIKIKNSGMQYGMFSKGYKSLKEKYWSRLNYLTNVVEGGSNFKVDKLDLDENVDSFYRAVFGTTMSFFNRKIKPIVEKDHNAFRNKFESLAPKYKAKLLEIYDEIVNDENIPKGTKRMQISLAKGQINKLSMSYDEFINSYILRNK